LRAGIAWGRGVRPVHYILGPDDQITILASDVEEISESRFVSI
jgi:hypothetical protein